MVGFPFSILAWKKENSSWKSCRLRAVQTFFLLRVSRKVFLHLVQSKSPISIWVFFPDLSALPAITHFFFGEAASVPHVLHFAKRSPP
jgi:hypothetical protein